MDMGGEGVSRVRLHGLGLCEVALVPPLRTLLIGNGYFGSLYRERIKESAHYELTAIVDEDATKLTDDAMIVSTSLADALGSIDLDVAVIATPPSTHRVIIERCFAAGLHVFCAKPGGLGSFEAHHIAKVAKKHDRRLFIDYTMMSAPESNTIDQQFNVLGEPVLMQAIRNVVTPAKPEGIVFDLMSHDLACFYTMMTPEKITHVQCDTSDTAAIAYLYEGERCVAMMNASYEARTPKKEVVFFIEPRKPITNPRMKLVWNQAERVVSVHSQSKQLDLHFIKHPDPIMLALARFHREAFSSYTNQFSIDQHWWVSMAAECMDFSAKHDAEKVPLNDMVFPF